MYHAVFFLFFFPHKKIYCRYSLTCLTELILLSSYMFLLSKKKLWTIFTLGSLTQTGLSKQCKPRSALYLIRAFTSLQVFCIWTSDMLTLKALSNIVGRDILVLFFFFFFFSAQLGHSISCGSFAGQMIHMKCYVLFKAWYFMWITCLRWFSWNAKSFLWEKKNKTNFRLSSATFA